MPHSQPVQIYQSRRNGRTSEAGGRAKQPEDSPVRARGTVTRHRTRRRGHRSARNALDVRHAFPGRRNAPEGLYAAFAAMAADSRSADRCGDSGGGLPFCGGKQARSVEYLGGSSTLAIE